ncbi:hypothetical protein BO71DRAFT_328097, partial [Aspergillus ellipticus CBS 707.79]
ITEYCIYNITVKKTLYIKKLVEIFSFIISKNNKIFIFSNTVNFLKILNYNIFIRFIYWLNNYYLFITDLIKKNIIKIFYISNNINSINRFTKLLESKVFSLFRTLLEIIIYFIIIKLKAIFSNNTVSLSYII